MSKYKESLVLSGVQREILVGTILGDASMRAMKANADSNVKFEQQIKQTDYVNHLFEQFHEWVGTPPTVRDIKGGGAADRQSIWFRTYGHPAFNEYKELFYKVDASGKQYKVVPDNIAELLTPRALAYWFMDDGSLSGQNKTSWSYVLNTQSFSYNENLLLKQVLQDKFNLVAGIQKDKHFHKLGLSSHSRDTFRTLIELFVLPSFHYKLFPKASS